MTWLAFRNLFQSKARLVISVGGVGLSLLLILTLDAIFTGMQRRVTAYIDHSGADVFVSQSGVRNMHMASSSLPGSFQAEIEAVAGVETVTPILYLTNAIVAGDERSLAYIIGVPAGAEVGGAWEVSAGSLEPRPGEVIIDRGVAEAAGVGLGDEVEILARPFTLAGLSAGTAGLTNSVAFISLSDFAALRGNHETVSFFLVQVTPGESPETVAGRIEAEVGQVTAQSRTEFARQERRVIRDMAADVLALMNLIGFLIGLAVMALTVYTATLARRAEYGVLKALGARNGHLYRSVLAQAFLSVALGFGLGLVITILLSVLVPQLGTSLEMEVSGASLLKVGSASLVIAAVSAVLPIRQIAGLDPAMVFRGR